MNDLDRHVEGAARAHQVLLARLEEFGDEEGGRPSLLPDWPSLLPDWTVGHVLSHLASNADSHTRMIEAACRGEVAEQYVGGRDGRAREIAERAGLSAVELVSLVRRSIWRLEGAWATCTAEGWQGTGNTVAGPAPIHDLPFRRWRETVVHHADLGLGYTWHDWPAEYVRFELPRVTMLWSSRRPMGLTELPAAAMQVPDAQRVAWLLGRAEIDGLAAAEVFG